MKSSWWYTVFWQSLCCSFAKSYPTLFGPMDCRLPCPPPSPGVCSNSCPLTQWCHPTISSSVRLLASIFPSIRVFSNESALHMWWLKYWSFSFSISPSNEYSELISSRIDWFDLAVQGTLKNLQHHSSKASILHLWKMPLEFWQRSYWIYRLLW